MFYIQKILFLCIVTVCMVNCCDSLSLFAVGSPLREHADVLTSISDITCAGALTQCEILDSGCPLHVFFNRFVLQEADDAIAIEWLKDLFNSVPADKISQNEIDYMLVHACARPTGSLELVKTLLSLGADPCSADQPPLLTVFDQLYQHNSDAGLVFRKLHTMLQVVKHDDRIRQDPDQDYLDAANEFMKKKAFQIDCSSELRRKFVAFGGRQSPARYKKYDVLLSEIHKLLPPPVEYSSDEEV